MPRWRVYLDAERGFGSRRNVYYQANVGARFSFGDITKSLPKTREAIAFESRGEEAKSSLLGEKQ